MTFIGIWTCCHGILNRLSELVVYQQLYGPAVAYLMDMLAEGRHSGQLADDVQVGSAQSVDGATVIHWQAVLIGQNQVLEQTHAKPDKHLKHAKGDCVGKKA